MVLMPPGSAKSLYSSVAFPAWYLGRQSKRTIIGASYGDALIRKMGRRARSIIKQSRYQAIFNCSLSPETSAASEWSIRHADGNESSYIGAGILASVTGTRAHGIIIDDPVKGRDEAESEKIRESTYDAYRDDLLTRLIPGGWLVLVQTRWHMDDLAGRILPENWRGESGLIQCRDGMTWRVICIPAKAERPDDLLGRKMGEYLWPEWFKADHWRQFESSSRTWSSLYQQRPAPLEGGLFKPDKIQVVDAIPAGRITWCRGWDLAATIDGDYTAGAKLGKLDDGRFIIADMQRQRYLADDRDRLILNTASADSRMIKISIPQDPGQAGKSLCVHFAKLLSGFSVEFTPESGDKITRAEPFAAQVNVGNVLMMRGEWNYALIEEMRMFPNGSYDDQIDALSRAFAKVGLRGKSLLTV